MLRYELHSNVAASEQGLQRHPALNDLVRTLAARQVEVRVVRQTHTEEGEINLASSRVARGVTVRGRAQRTLPAHAHLRGCLAWLRAVARRPERGLHVELDETRGPNGAALLFAQLLGTGQHVFLSLAGGSGTTLATRLTTAPDLALAALPPPIAADATLRREYLDRAARPTGFLAALERLSALELLPGKAGAVAAEALSSRDPSRLAGLSEAQIVNIGLLDDTAERYERLVEQFCAQIGADNPLGDLPQLFELLLQGIPLDGLRRRFDPYLLPDRRDAVTNKRTLVHELRIGLRQGDDPVRERFRHLLLREVVRRRAVEDARVYTRVHTLPPMDAQRLDALEEPREAFLAWLTDPAAAPAADPRAEGGLLPPAARQGLFELMVRLAFQARASERFREGSEPASVQLARHLLQAFTLRHFDVRRLDRLNPALPPRGVARNLAAKVPVTQAEMQHIQLALWTALFPLGRLAGALYRELAAGEAERRRAESEQARTAFLQGGHQLLRATNYVLGHGGGDPLLRTAALAAGEALGLYLLGSRDQMRRRAATATTALEAAWVEQEADGYQLLMHRDEARWFPLRTAPVQLAGAYLHLMRERTGEVVRRLVAGKLNFLHQQYGRGLFAHLHDQFTWRVGLALAPRQLAALLTRAGVFDANRLAEFGFDPADTATQDTGDPLLAAALAATASPASETAAPPAAQLAPFLGSRIEARCRAALKEVQALTSSYGTPPTGDGPHPLAGTLAALLAEDQYDLPAGPARKALATTREAAALTTALEGLLAPHVEALRALHEDNEGLEVPLAGRLALLCLLREHHDLRFEDHTQHVRLVRAARPAPPNSLPGALAAALQRHLAGAAGKPLAQAVGLLERHHAAWRGLVHASTLPLLDQMLRETVLRIAQPAPPAPADLRALPAGAVLCVGASAHDQGRFAPVAARPDHPHSFLTLSGLMSRLAEFGRLREELAGLREVVADVREVIAGLNLSIYDAPYVRRYTEALHALDDCLSVRPEDFTAEDLAALHEQARAVGTLVRESFEQERTVALRDRWMTRISQGLRRIHPELHLTFVDRLHEQARHGDGAAPRPDARAEDHQTFSERVRRVIAFRERMASVRAVVLAPTNTQRRLALSAIDQLYRLTGVHTPLFVDVSRSGDLVGPLRTRVPPHRLFEMASL